MLALGASAAAAASRCRLGGCLCLAELCCAEAEHFGKVVVELAARRRRAAPEDVDALRGLPLRQSGDLVRVERDAELVVESDEQLELLSVRRCGV